MANQIADTPKRKTSGVRKATVTVHRPAHVPAELMSIWTAAAQRVANQNRLLKLVRTASGAKQRRIDYVAVNRTYRRILAAYIDQAEKAEEATTASEKQESPQKPAKQED
jgi:hypothetical protein